MLKEGCVQSALFIKLTVLHSNKYYKIVLKCTFNFHATFPGPLKSYNWTV